MELHDWLLDQGYLKQEEYGAILVQQFKNSLEPSVSISNPDGFLEKSPLHSVGFRKHPVGDVLQHMDIAPSVYQCAGVADLDALVHEWHLWSLTNLEPLGNYSTNMPLGRNLYANVAAKKEIAKFLVMQPVHDSTLICDSDTVAILEGSSAFYVGMAVGAFRKNCKVITSNGALFREYLDSPLLAEALTRTDSFTLIGGNPIHSSDDQNGGVFGPTAQRQYVAAITKKPKATVVVMPVSGLTAAAGPYATLPPVRELKAQIMECCIGDKAEQRVREFIFIADHSKLVADDMHTFGSPVLDRDVWIDYLKHNEGRVSLVVSPPPTLNQALCSMASQPHLAKRSAADIESTSKVTLASEDQKYLKATRELASLFHDGRGRLTIHEVLLPPSPAAAPTPVYAI